MTGQPASPDPGAAPTPAPAPSLADRVRSAPAVWLLGALNVAAYLWIEALGGVTSERMVASGALVVPLLPGEPWRLLTSGFLHFSAMHLVANLVGLALFGPAFERLVGTVRFTALWVVSILTGSALVVALADDLVIAAGASGAVFGLLGALVVLGIRTRHTVAGRIRLRQALVLLGINLAFGILEPQVSLEAHAGGALGGMLVLAAYAPRRPRPSEPPRSASPTRGLGFAAAVGLAAVWFALQA